MPDVDRHCARAGCLCRPGAAIFLLLEETLAMYTEHWMLYLGPFLVIVVIFAKHGLFGLLAGGRNND